MPGHRYVEEISLVAMLVTKRLTGVTPEVNFRECVIHMPLLSTNKAAHSGFETQRRHHQKSKIGVLVTLKKDFIKVLEFCFSIEYLKFMISRYSLIILLSRSHRDNVQKRKKYG